MKLKTRPLTDGFGLEVLEVDLAQVDDDAFAALRDLWQDNPLLLLRRQSITESELVAFSRRFGELDIVVREDLHSPTHPEVIYVTNMKKENGERLGGLGSYELNWHTDQSYREKPATGSIFFAVEMPEGQAKTSWCSTELAYAALPADLQAELETLKGVTKYRNFERDIKDEAKLKEIHDRTPAVAHPLVLTHPKSGGKSLYVDISKTYEIEGLPPVRGEALLKELKAVMTRPEFVYTHSWRPGDVMMWDNGRLCHRRDPFDATLPRLAKRTTIHMHPGRFPVPA